MIIQHNMSAMNANRQLGITQGQLSKSTEKLSSGYRINRAGDDAAGLAISEKMRGQIRGLDQASTNSQDGISLIQTAEGALTETHSILQRMRELSVKAATGTSTDDDRTQIQQEITQLTSEVDRIANTTEFNTMKLLDGSKKGISKQTAGTGKVEGNFANGQLKVVFTDAFSMAAADDVIRITVKSISGGVVLSIDSLFNTVVTVAGDLSDGTGSLQINNAGYVTSAFSTGVFDSAAVTNFDIKISLGGGKLEVGDVITISLGKAKGPVPAEAGKDGIRLQIGANASQEVEMGIDSMKASDLKIAKADGSALDVKTQNGASMAIEAFDMAIKKVSTSRSKMGAIQNRLEHTIANLDTSSENLQAAESRIRDVNMAKEMTSYSKSNILMQAGQSMLAQANQSTQGVLSLLQ